MPRMKILRIAVFLVLTAVCSWAQQPVRPTEVITEKPTIRAVPMNPGESDNVDGRLDEPAWQRAEPAADFKQSDPQNGATATERTLEDQDYEKTWSRITPMGRPGTVEDVANAVLFLVSPQSRHITGQTIVVDGGWTATSPSPY